MHGHGLDAAFLRSAVDSSDRWRSRVRTFPIMSLTVLGTGALAIVLTFVEPLARNLPLVSVQVAFAMLAAAATAVLLWLRTDVLHDQRVGWAAPGYVAAALLMLMSVEQLPDLYLGAFRAVSDGSAAALAEVEAAFNRAMALHLTWHVVFAGAALGGLLLEERAVVRRTFFAGVVGLGLLLANSSVPATLDLVDLDALGPDGLPLTSTYYLAAGLTMALLLGTALAWSARVGAHPPVARAWVGITLVLVAVELTFQMLAGAASTTFAATAVAMQALAFLVGLAGQILGLRSTIAGQFAFEQDVASRYAAGTVVDGPDADTRPDAELVTPEDVRRAISGEGLEVHLQPIVELDTSAPAGFEALSRFGPTLAGTALTPDRWFRAARAHGLALPMELAAVRLALATLPDLPEGTYLSINVGPETLVSTPLLHLLEKVDAKRVLLELTEHAPVDDYADLAAALDGLRALGAGIAVDDAGAGFSSLRHITRLGPDVLKVDISLVRDVHRLPLSKAMIASLVAYANRVGARIVAEGVEDRQEALALWSLGVGYGQGWHWSRALPPSEAVAVNTRLTNTGS